MSPTLPMSPVLRDLMRDEMRVLEILDRMTEAAKVADDKAADRFQALKGQLTSAVNLYRLGPGNPLPSLPVFVEYGGES